MVALLEIMSAVLLQGSSQRALPEENEPRQAFFLNGSHPTLGALIIALAMGNPILLIDYQLV